MHNPNIGRVVDVTNITKKDFTHPFNGAPFTVRAGETLTFPWDVGEHLARHLARRIFIEGDTGSTSYNPRNPDPEGGKVLWTEESEKAKMAEILGQSWTEAQQEKKSENEVLRDKVNELNEWRKTLEAGKSGGASRKQLIEELKSLGGAFVPTDSNEELKAKIEALKATPKTA